MTITELIRRLEELRERHGDLPVWRENEGGSGVPITVAVFLASSRWDDSRVLPDRVELD